MVRTQIMCAKCRKAKVKCIHDGTPPCQNCLKGVRTNLDDCVLSGPFDQRTRRRSFRHASQDVGFPSSGTSSRRSNTSRQQSVALRDSQKPDVVPLLTVQLAMVETPKSLLLQATKTFTHKFPELAFLHLPSVSLSINKLDLEKVQGLLTAILALCAPLLNATTKETIHTLRAAQEYGECIRNFISQEMKSAPKIEMVQTLLIISMYEWSIGSGYQAWMYSGMAIRMMQCLQIMERKQKIIGIAAEVKSRTYWSCFVLDKIIFHGASQQPALPLSSIEIPFPLGEQDFAFGTPSSMSRNLHQERSRVDSDRSVSTVDDYYGVLIRGFDIWSRIMELMTNGGRRNPKMLNPESSPWLTTSPWNVLYRDVKAWRRSQEDHLKYSDHFIAAQVSLGHGESTAYVNLIYYLCILILHREYVPFLPAAGGTHVGPVDAPSLDGHAPDDWWSDSARELFDAAECITRILSDLEDNSAPLVTPFAGFSAFSAATMNFYVSAFPEMNPGRTPQGETFAKQNIDYLKSFTEIWKKGQGWLQILQHVTTMFQRATNNQAELPSKTRQAFLWLDEAINSYPASSPPPDDLVLNGAATEHETSNEDQTGAVDMQELPTGNQWLETSETQHISDSNNFLDDHWGEVWPLWGDDFSIPFPINDLSFDANLGFLTEKEEA